jgi:cytochrome d ubiquinol oxidase subunit I
MIALVYGGIAALLQPISGDISAKDIAVRQPAKLAAMEAHFETGTSVPLIIGGIPDVEKKRVDYAIEIPGALSFLAHGDFEAEVIGLDQFPEDEHPPVLITHIAFQIMVVLGMVLVGLSLLFFFSKWKKKEWINARWFLWLFVLGTPLGFIAVEAGWTVTEVGRQPWIIYGILKTKDAVSPIPGIAYSFYLFIGIYLSLAVMVTFLLIRQIRAIPESLQQNAKSMDTSIRTET